MPLQMCDMMLCTLVSLSKSSKHFRCILYALRYSWMVNGMSVQVPVNHSSMQHSTYKPTDISINAVGVQWTHCSQDKRESWKRKRKWFEVLREDHCFVGLVGEPHCIDNLLYERCLEEPTTLVFLGCHMLHLICCSTEKTAAKIHALKAKFVPSFSDSANARFFLITDLLWPLRKPILGRSTPLWMTHVAPAPIIHKVNESTPQGTYSPFSSCGLSAFLDRFLMAALWLTRVSSTPIIYQVNSSIKLQSVLTILWNLPHTLWLSKRQVWHPVHCLMEFLTVRQWVLITKTMY